jgi:hypothetical protein
MLDLKDNIKEYCDKIQISSKDLINKKLFLQKRLEGFSKIESEFLNVLRDFELNYK